MKWKKFKKEYGGTIFVSPVILGILIFTLIPMGLSLYYSLHDYKMNWSSGPINFGFQNYIALFTEHGEMIWNSLYNTFKYAIIWIPLEMILSFSIALLLNQKIKGISKFRVIYYLPVLMPTIVSSLVWRDMTNETYGYFNMILEALNLPTQTFFSQAETTFGAMLFMNTFGLGGSIVLWLAQLKSVPQDLYEVADVEGAGRFAKLFYITIPMCTPMIFFKLVTGIISSLQVFGSVLVLRNPMNDDVLNYFVVKIYDTAFTSMDMGFGCAMSWLLFLITALLSGIVFKTSKWVYYGE